MDKKYLRKFLYIISDNSAKSLGDFQSIMSWLSTKSTNWWGWMNDFFVLLKIKPRGLKKNKNSWVVTCNFSFITKLFTENIWVSGFIFARYFAIAQTITLALISSKKNSSRFPPILEIMIRVRLSATHWLARGSFRDHSKASNLTSKTITNSYSEMKLLVSILGMVENL